MNKKILILISSFVVCFGFAFGQVSVNPDHEFYYELERWEALGLIEQQSPLRPYPIGKIEDVLNVIAQCDNEKEASKAKAMYESIFEKKWNLVLDVNGTFKKSSLENDKDAFIRIGVEGDAAVFNGFSVGYELTGFAGRGYIPGIMPAYHQNSATLSDSSFVGPILGCLECNGNFAYKNGNFYAQTGINRLSLGLFLDDGLAISNNARHTVNAALSYDNGFINYTEGMIGLVATNGEGEKGVLYPNKFLSFHSIGVNFNKNFSLGFYEAAIFGNRFDPAYFIPMPYLVTEGVTGFNEDNVFMGGTMIVRPGEGFTWKIDGFLDDFGITKWSQYHDFKLRCSGRTSLEYVSPYVDWLDKVSLDYTFVTPYMYTHVVNYGGTYPISDVNYQIYDNAGRHLGTALEPNSDRIQLAATFKPVTGLTIGLGGSFIRHSNINENLSMSDQLGYIRAPYGYAVSDGSIRNHGLVPENYPYTGFDTDGWYQVNFMKQDTVEYTMQANLNAKYSLPKMKIGNLSIEMGYTFEFIKNYGVSTDIFSNYLRSGHTADDTIFVYVYDVYHSNGDVSSVIVGNGKDGYYGKTQDELKSNLTEAKANEIANKRDDGKKVGNVRIEEVSIRRTYDESDVAAALQQWKDNMKDVFNHYFTIKFIYRF